MENSQKIMAITPAHICDPQIAIAASRAGEMGILDLGFRSDPDTMAAALDKLVSFVGKKGHWGIRWDTLGLPSRDPARLGKYVRDKAPVLILAGIAVDEIVEARKKAKRIADKIFLEVYDLRSAQAAQSAGYDGMIAKGYEAGGRVSSLSSFILLQELHEKIDIPYWIQGGIGQHTAAAAFLAGVTGIVLCEQLWLTEEGPFSVEERKIWQHLDGSETICIGNHDVFFRCFTRRGQRKLGEFEEALAEGHGWQETLSQWLLKPDNEPLIPCGQDIGLASNLAEQFGTVGRVLFAIQKNVSEYVSTAKNNHTLSKGSPLAKAHGTSYPIVQGPMANVSDVAPFCKAVANAGALPFLAMSAMTGPMIRSILERAQAEMGSLRWGVGILGFLPHVLRQEQFNIIREFKPPFVIIAGGHPSQASEYEDAGISTYLHVPSPGLLSTFIKEGAHKLILEGRECGGHVGPLTSFILWESAINCLLENNSSDPERLQILFSGGIHDGLSAAMVQTLAAPLTALGIKIGVLMGSAYLFCDEAVQHGAITPEYQRQVIGCESTVLIQSGIGHESCCIKTPFVEKFYEEKQKLIRSGKPDSEVRDELELMNLGRLRIAAKGISCRFEKSSNDNYVKHVIVDEVLVDEETQRREGLYLIGQLAQLHTTTFTIADLHADVSEKSLEYLEKAASSHKQKAMKAPGKEDIAIIGMSCMFPGARDVRSFWENIVKRVHAIREVSDDRWSPEDFFDPNRLTPDKSYSKWGGFLNEVQFDPTKYGTPPASLSSIEPVQLLSLEVARQALEDAGFDRLSIPRERTAVVFGAGGINDLAIGYIFRTMLMHYLPRVEGLKEETRQNIIHSLYQELPKWNEDSFPGLLGNVIAGRIANRLDLLGSNFTVDAACASSMAALDVAINRLRSGDADVALVGAGDCTNNAVSFLAFAKTQTLSPRGQCCPFDDKADGIVISEGVAAVVLKRLRDAQRDGDRIYGVIKGIGSSSDGRNRSLTAPHPQGQVMAVHRAYEDAGVDPRTVELVEAHGTGTAVGDKAEIESLNLAFGDVRDDRQYCAVGSVKSIIGHTKVSAGLASLIKSVLALKHRVLPATIGVEVPNSHVDFTHTPFYINTETRPWFNPHRGKPRRCGVSAFGFGGTNFHAVLEEYTGDYRSSDRVDFAPRDAEIVALSRARRSEVEQALRLLVQGLEHPDCVDLAQLGYSVHLEERRRRPDREGQVCRLAIIATSVSDLKQKLQMALQELGQKTAIENPQGVYYREADSAAGSVCFLFPGQGSQRVHMLQDLVVGMPELHDLFERADILLQDHLAHPLSSYIYPLPAFSDEERERQQTELNATHIAQPALGVADLTALKVLERFGLQPDFVVGHSYGEYVALSAAGVLSQDDLIRLSEIRGRIVAQTSKTNPGAMAAVQADEEKVREMITRLRLSVTPANMNTPEQTIVAGSVGAVQKAIISFSKEGLTTRKIPVTAAFHTDAMAGAGKALRKELEKITFREPVCKIYSNTLGDIYPENPDSIRDLLGRHISEPVRFLEQIRKLYHDGARVFIESGPGLVLGGLVDRILANQPHTTLYIDVPGRPGWIQLAHLLAQAFILGLPVDINRWFQDRCLADIKLDAVLEKAHARANPGPLIWRVNGGKAIPWNKKPGTKPTRREPPALSAIRPGISGSIPATTQEKAAVTQLTQQKTPDHDPLLSQIQASMDQFLELQRQQQEMMQRFLDMQERLMSAVLSDQVGQPTPARLKPSTGSPGSRAQAVPPAPVLPKFVVTPSTGWSKPTQAIQSQVTPTAIKSAIPTPVQSVSDSDTARGLPTTEQFQADLVRAVSERTGYPEEMLELDAHLEAELGIDSIKRVEIFSVLKEHHNLLEGQDEETVLEELAGLKTLRRIVEWYDTNRARALEAGGAQREKFIPPLSPIKHEATGANQIGATIDPVRRYVVKPVAAPLDELASEKAFPAEHLMVLLGEAPALSAALHAAMTGMEYRVRQIIPGKRTRTLGKGRFEVDFSSIGSVKNLHGLLTGSGETVGAVFNLMGLAAVTGDSQDGHLDNARQLFLLLKVFEKDLKESARRGGGWLINITALDGQFGLRNSRAFPVETAGSLGVAKSVAREWPHVRVKCIDVDVKMDPHMLVAQVWKELGTDDPLIEVGFTQDGRWKLDLAEDGGALTDLSKIDLDSDAVILVTGGAYGITAEITKILASQYRPHLVLVGRSSLPKEESEVISSFQDPQHLREFLIKELRAKKPKVVPAEVERLLKRILKDRQIRENIIKMESAGAKVTYRPLDVRNAVAFGELIDEIYAQWGRIDGVIHGAGVIDDKLIKSKLLKSFETVFATKVIPAIVLRNKLRPEMLKFVAFFSSVAARFGNVGQLDYSAANEVLNKLADRLSHEWPNVHVVSINWGPWDFGMVRDELRRLYAAKGIHLVPADVGARFGIEELRGGNACTPEVVIASSIKQISEWGLGSSLP